MKIKKIDKCRFCKSKKLEKVISLGHQNLQGYFKKENNKNQNKFIE